MRFARAFVALGVVLLAAALVLVTMRLTTAGDTLAARATCHRLDAHPPAL